MKAKGASAAVVLNPVPVISFDHKRDAYGFAVRPQHVQRYREYANIYKEEEEERSDRWKEYLERQSKSWLVETNNAANLNFESANLTADDNSKNAGEPEDSNDKTNHQNLKKENEVQSATDVKVHRVQIWTEIRPSLRAIEDMMSARVKKNASSIKNESDPGAGKPLPSIEEAKPGKGASEDDSEEEFYDLERAESDPIQDITSGDSVPAPTVGAAHHATDSESLPPWKEEMECLVQGGVPMALRGELWQAFVGVKARRVEKYYHNLLAPDNCVRSKKNELEDKIHEPNPECAGVPEKWKGQIEKDLPRTFPGHPALDDDGRNALRRLLTAYARHNPSVGYCQAMNFFAGLLLLLMPEENAFWALMGILDDYFDGYYSEEMIESQVDQLVLEELCAREISQTSKPSGLSGSAGGMGDWAVVPYDIYEYASVGKWMKLIFVQFCAGPALVTTKDAGDAVTLLQSLAGSTFDSSQLVLTACMGYQNVNEKRLQELRNKHRPDVKAALEERSKGFRVWRDSQVLASKLYNFKQAPDSTAVGTDKPEGTNADINDNVSHLDASSDNVNGPYMSLNGDMEVDPAKDLQEQAMWLKVELCKLLEEKRSAELRAEELEIALVEMVKQDNRRQLSARVEQLEREVSELRQLLIDKHEQENAMLQILMRVEQEQKVAEDARISAEQDAAAQRYAAQVLQTLIWAQKQSPGSARNKARTSGEYKASQPTPARARRNMPQRARTRTETI
ncbi:UNVERIFIED_CONTAM: TBC1 domain family member 9B [Sesamum angustifolium]|uniref:TBC1 domain family member 9B n=1 Tax=Sesamum angustifolium TaxID=2727405 RepID=A0AAW2PRY3_9LAMI